MGLLLDAFMWEKGDVEGADDEDVVEILTEAHKEDLGLHLAVIPFLSIL